MYCVLLPRSLSHSFLIDVIYMGEVSRLLHFFSDAISTAENAGRDHTSCSQAAPHSHHFGFILFSFHLDADLCRVNVLTPSIIRYVQRENVGQTDIKPPRPL